MKSKILILSAVIIFLISIISATSSAITLSACGQNLNASGSYLLNQSITSTATCLTTNSSDVVIDCAGYTITYGTAGGNSAFGISALHPTASQINLTIKNCIITKPSASGSSGRGIVLTRFGNSTIVNNTIRTNGTTSNIGIYVVTGANGNNVSGNNIVTSTGATNYGIYFNAGSSDSIAEYNNITTGAGTATSDNCGIVIADPRAIIRHNWISTSGSADSNFGIFASGSSSTQIVNNTIYTSGTNGNNRGVYLSASDLNIVANNTINTTGQASPGIYLSASNSVNVLNNQINSSADAIYMFSSTLSDFTTANISRDNTRFGRNITVYGGGALTLPCPNNTVIDNPADGGLKFIGCNNITVQNWYRPNRNTDGLLFVNSDNNNIINNTLNGGLNGLDMINSAGLCDNNLIANNTFSSFGYLNDYAIRVYGTYNLITGNNLSTSGVTSGNNAINIQNDFNNITNNIITTGRTTGNVGINLEANVDNTLIQNNTITASGTASGNTGIYLVDTCLRNTVRNNTINTAGTSGNLGIRLVSGSNNNVIEYNTFYTKGSTSGNNGLELYSSSNNTFRFNNVYAGYGTGTTDNDAVSLVSSSNNNFTDNVLFANGTATSITSSAMFLQSASTNNTFVNNIITKSVGNAIEIDFSTTYPSGNTFQNNSLNNISGSDLLFMDASINDTSFINQQIRIYNFTGVGGKINVEDSQFGKIAFLSPINGSGANMSNDIKVLSNLAQVSSSNGLNKPANVTLRGVNTAFFIPGIFKDGAVCTDCYNFTSLNAGNVTFNVTSWSNYSIVETLSDSTPPASVTNLANQSSGASWIYWNWTNPADADFGEAIIYIDSVNVANTSNNYYNATGLISETDYTISIHTKDIYGNINNTDVNSTARTLDITPPSSITDLANQSSGRTWIYWNWTNPADADFGEAIIYIDSVNVANTSNNYYNATGLTCNSSYVVTVHTKDASGNVNNSDINDSASTLACNNDPVVTTPAITPLTAYTNDDLNCTFAVTDDDAGDSLTANYTWYNGTNALITGALSVTNGTQYSIILGNGNTTKGETWNCSITPYDEHYYGAAKSTTRTISNSLPTAPVVDVLPDIPNDNNDLAVSITTSSTDADNDSITYSYQWYKNNVSQAGQTSTTLSNLLTSVGETWKCIVTPNDGTGNGATGQDSATINGTSTAYAINLVSPINGATWNLSDNVTFEYNSTLEVSNCSLIINGAIIETEDNITTNATETFATILSNAAYTWAVNCTDINNTTNSSATWTLTVSYLYCGDGTCNNGETCSSCSGDCGTCSSGGGGGGGTRRIVNNTANVTNIIKNETKFEFGVPGIEIEQISSMVANPGESKKISVNVKNSGTGFLNKCKLSGFGNYGSWISSGDMKDLSIGQEAEFLFNLDLPKEISPGTYKVGLSVICQEATKSSEIELEVIQKKLAVEMNDAKRLENGNLNISYSLVELSGQMQEVDVQIMLMGSKGVKIAETNEKRIVQANSRETFDTEMEIPADIEEGNLNLLINANSKTASAFVQEYVLLERGSLSGLSIFDGENSGNIVSAALVLAFIVFAFIIGRRILRFEGMEKRKNVLSALAGSIMHHKRSFDNRTHYHVAN